MADKDTKKTGKALASRKILQGLLIGLITAAVAVFTGNFSFSKKLELITLDLRYKIRPQVEMLPEVGFIDYDDSSLELFGEWPWPRMRQVALVKTLDFYNARMAGYDVFFVEKENTVLHSDRLKRLLSLKNGGTSVRDPAGIRQAIDDSFKSYDREFAYAMKQANNIYLSYFAYDPDESTAAGGLPALLKETERRRKGFSALKKEAIQEVEKTFPPVPREVERYLYKTVDVDAPIPELARAARGIGFAQPGIDDDSVKRNFIFFRYYNRQMLCPVTLKMLSDILDFRLSDIEIHPGKYIVLRNALDYKTGKRKDILIPVDEHCQTLLNWAGPFDKTFIHVPFRLISYYYAYNAAREVARRYNPPSPPFDKGVKGGLSRTAFNSIRESILSRIMEEGMVTQEEADRISKEISAAHLITRYLEANLSRAEISGRLKGVVEDGLLRRVLSIVSASRAMGKALSANPSLTFDRFVKNERAGPEPVANTSHLREAFRNIKFFAENKRLREIRPYYFPEARQVLSSGKWTEFSPVDLKGKIFMIGLTGTNTIDLQPTPFEENCPLVAYHVNAINTILTQNFLHHPPRYYKQMAAVILAVSVGVAGIFFSIPVSFMLTSITTGGYLFATYKIWDVNGYWLEWVVPLTGIILSYMTIIVLQFVRAFREKKKVRGIFSAMVSPAVLKVMEENPDKFSLTGERKPVTTFFSMINGMGNVTKTVAPDELTSLLSIYLTPTSDIIMDYDGYIDKYEGHVIMADFGMPLDDEGNPWKCAFAAIEQKMDIEAFRYFMLAKYGMKVGVSMGFNYGYVSAGNMGSERKFQYTVMGDAVNIAARFMASNYIYNSNYAITGEDTLPVIADYIHFCPLDRLLLKGRTKPTAIYKVLGWKRDAYIKLCGNRPVPEFLRLIWAKCPPEKIFGYHHLWSEKSRQTGHPMAQSIHKFFEGSLDAAGILLVSGWKKEIISYNERIESIKADIRKNLNIDFKSTDRARDYREVIEGWTANLNLALGAIRENGLQDEKGGNAELLLNKIDILKLHLDEKAAGIYGDMDERIVGSLSEIRDFMPSAHSMNAAQLDQALRDNYRKYGEAVGEFYKTIKNKKDEYHEMMSLAGSPVDNELLAMKRFEEGLNLYWQRQWDDALGKFKEAGELSDDKGPAASIIERVMDYRKKPPGENWQGEFVQTKK